MFGYTYLLLYDIILCMHYVSNRILDEVMRNQKIDSFNYRDVLLLIILNAKG